PPSRGTGVRLCGLDVSFCGPQAPAEPLRPAPEFWSKVRQPSRLPRSVVRSGVSKLPLTTMLLRTRSPPPVNVVRRTNGSLTTVTEVEPGEAPPGVRGGFGLPKAVPPTMYGFGRAEGALARPARGGTLFLPPP